MSAITKAEASHQGALPFPFPSLTMIPLLADAMATNTRCRIRGRLSGYYFPLLSGFLRRMRSPFPLVCAGSYLGPNYFGWVKKGIFMD